MILGRTKGQKAGPVGERKEAHFFAQHELLDHDLCSGVAEPATEHMLDRVPRFLSGLGNDHAFACCQPVGFDHNWQAEVCKPRKCVGFAGIALIGRRRNIRGRAKIFDKAFGSLKLRRCFAWPEDRNPRRAQRIGKPGDQRTFWPDHHQTNIMGLTKGDDCSVIRAVKVHQHRLFANPGVARRGVECIARIDKACRLLELPRQSMFAPAAADEKDVHGR